MPTTHHQAEALHEMPVLMPLGGYASRAQAVTEGRFPKHLIKLGNGQTVLDTILRGLQSSGFNLFVFCVAHLRDQLRSHLDQGHWIERDDVDYVYSEEDKPSGVDGAVLQAVGDLGLKGNGIILPGDLLLPWPRVAAMARWHLETASGITIGVTSYITPRTTDVGKLIVNEVNGHLVQCLARDEPTPPLSVGQLGLTSAAATGIDFASYTRLCETYRQNYSVMADRPLSLRDHVMPWALEHNQFTFHTYDLQGEALDLGTPDNIRYGQENWSNYV